MAHITLNTQLKSSDKLHRHRIHINEKGMRAFSVVLNNTCLIFLCAKNTPNNRRHFKFGVRAYS